MTCYPENGTLPPSKRPPLFRLHDVHCAIERVDGETVELRIEDTRRGWVGVLELPAYEFDLDIGDRAVCETTMTTKGFLVKPAEKES